MFITLEGIDGSGKSTQSKNIADWLKSKTQSPVILTHEPSYLRSVILGLQNLCAISELLLFLADRAEHVEREILPALSSGWSVVCERWNESTLAYQSGGHKLSESKIRELIRACEFPEPDVKIFLDIEPKTAMKRVNERGKKDKFEEEGLKLLSDVAEFYRGLPDMVRIECDGRSEDEVFREITRHLEELT